MATPVTPIFYLPYPFVLPRSSRPRNLTQIVQFFHFLFNFLESEVIKEHMRTVSTSPYKFLCFAVCPPVVLVLGRPVKQWSSCGIGGHAVCRLLCVLEERKKTSEIYTGKGKKSLRPEEQAAVGQLRLFCVVGNDGEYTAEDGQFIRCICGAKSKLNKPWNHNNFLAHYDKCAFVQTANKLSANGTGVPGSKQDGSKIAAFFTKAAKEPSPPPKLESHKSQRRPHRKLNLHFGGKQRRCRLDLKKNHCEQKYPLCLFRFSASVRNTA